jgi:hypothetical protein
MKFQEFKKAINKPYFSKMDILLKELNAPSSQLSLWRKKGLIVPLKRGLYCFSDEKEKLLSELVSVLLYEPSYLSMEFALSHYGFIPEMVFMNTAITTKTTRKFSNIFGAFSYRHIQPKLFFGYTVILLSFGKYLLAEPEKALLDYLYFNLGKLNNENDISELRLNNEELRKTIDVKKLHLYMEEFGIAKMKRLVDIILRYADI